MTNFEKSSLWIESLKTASSIKEGASLDELIKIANDIFEMSLQKGKTL
mgnify:CR=1 FL=1